jgi:hypothetical protein
MKTIRRSHHNALAGLNIAPLPNLVFVLLVIFITTPQLMNRLVVIENQLGLHHEPMLSSFLSIARNRLFGRETTPHQKRHKNIND